MTRSRRICPSVLVEVTFKTRHMLTYITLPYDLPLLQIINLTVLQYFIFYKATYHLSCRTHPSQPIGHDDVAYVLQYL